MHLIRDEIQKAVVRSQHCQRNWDISKEIPEEDLNLIAHAATQCPSKQNVAYYDVYFITNRDLIEKIHNSTNGFFIDGKHRTNSQVMANLLVVFADKDLEDVAKNIEAESFHRNTEMDTLAYNGLVTPAAERDVNMAIGVAAGYVNLTASLLGYRTGCCACFDGVSIQKLLNSNTVRLLMGVGYPDEARPRREHHLDSSIIFPTLKKQEVNYTVIK